MYAWRRASARIWRFSDGENNVKQRKQRALAAHAAAIGALNRRSCGAAYCRNAAKYEYYYRRRNRRRHQKYHRRRIGNHREMALLPRNKLSRLFIVRKLTAAISSAGGNSTASPGNVYHHIENKSALDRSSIIISKRAVKMSSLL